MKIYLIMKNYGWQCEDGDDWTMFGGWNFAEAEYYTHERALRLYNMETRMASGYPCSVWEVNIESGEISEILDSGR